MKKAKQHKDNTKKAELLKLIGADKEEFLEEILKELAEEILQPKIEKIWLDESNALAYMIVLINGINDLEDVSLVKKILFWKEFFGKNNVKIRCLQASEKDFEFCSEFFSVVSFPTIIFSDDEIFTNYIKLENNILDKLKGEESHLIAFFNRLILMLRNNFSLEKINESINSKSYWKLFEKLEELKSLVSENKIKEVILRLLKSEIIKSKVRLHNELVTLSSNYQNLESNYRSGLIKEGDNHTQRNLIINRLLLIIDEIK